ncbi:MAG TPA: hypothetical protein VIU37_05020 [Candidatus Limnocylindrales bacterium]
MTVYVDLWDDGYEVMATDTGDSDDVEREVKGRFEPREVAAGFRGVRVVIDDMRGGSGLVPTAVHTYEPEDLEGGD